MAAAWLDRQLASHQNQLITTAVLTAATVSATIFSVQALRRKIRVDELKASIPNVDEGKLETVSRMLHLNRELISKPIAKVPDLNALASRSLFSKEEQRAAELAVRAQNGDYDEELIQEQLTRTCSFLTPGGLEKLRSAFVIVVGLGGVGSHCTTALARSGVSRIRIIDFDQVTLSSLNRHAVATLADVGTPKVSCVKKRLEATVPWVKWECYNEVWRLEDAVRLLDGKPDYVVDAIDNIDSKVALLKFCHEHGLKVISSVGAGCKSDPTKIILDDISASTEDPLSKSTRRRLRAAGISSGIPAAFSIEKPGPGKATLLPLPEEEFQRGEVGELSVLPDFRARILPVLGTMPAIFGYTLANWVMLELSGYPREISAGKARVGLYETILNQVQASEEKLVRGEGNAEDAYGLKVPLTKEDVGYLVEEVYRGKSAVSGLTTRLTLVRWRPSADGYKPNTSTDGQKSARFQVSELVCMTREEASKHEKQVLVGRTQPEDVYEEGVIGRIDARMKEEAVFSRYR